MLSKKEARSYASYLVSIGKNDITKLGDFDKEMLTAYLIDSYSKYHAYEFIGEPDESNEYAHLLSSYIKTHDESFAKEIIDLMIKGAVKYAGNQIVDLLKEQDEELKFEQHYSKGY